MGKGNNLKYKMELREDGRIADMIRNFRSSVMRDPAAISIHGRFTKKKKIFFGKNP
jgi:hypothetical protein